MAGAGVVILFVVSLVGCTIWTLIYSLFASHYFLTTITESSAGHDEVQYPREGFFDWWWKPIFCAWVLSIWVIPLAVLLAPLAAISPAAFLAVFVGLIWLLFPLSLLSALYTGNWFFFMHPVILWRMLRHYPAFAYVHLLTLMAAAACGVFLFLALTRGVLWAIPAVLAIPTAILFYARHWGRFAWLSLNFLPRKKKPRKNVPASASVADVIPEVDVDEIDPADEGIRAGPPPNLTSAVQATVPSPSAAAEEDEWAMDKAPYPVIDDPAAPAFQESAAQTIPAAVPAPAASSALDEEEDEWATDKKPYAIDGDADFKPAPVADDADGKPDADKPVSVSDYYDRRADRDRAARKKAKDDETLFGMPTPSKKTPTFADAMFFGVWRFLIYERTLTVWFNLMLLTIGELFFLFLVKQFWPRLPD